MLSQNQEEEADTEEFILAQTPPVCLHLLVDERFHFPLAGLWKWWPLVLLGLPPTFWPRGLTRRPQLPLGAAVALSFRLV